MIYPAYPWGGGYTKSEVDTLLNGKSDTSHTHIKSQITDFPSLATVATSGSYNDLTNKPTIPTVNNATLTIQKNGTDVKTFTANASSNVTCNISVPTKTSDLTNDSGFLTSHQDLSGYVPRSGGAVMTSDSLGRTVDNVEFRIDGGNGWGKGASVVMRGKDRSTDGGSLILHTQDSNGYCQMILKPDGTATWGNKKIDTIEEQGDGYIRYSNGLQICWGLGEYDIGQVVSYAKAFIEFPSVVTSPKANPINWHSEHFTMGDMSGSRDYVSWQAIGRWK